MRRPWKEFFKIQSFTRPSTMGEVTIRTKKNFNHFRINYAMIVLSVTFLSLLWHPISMIVFLVVSIAWYWLYLSREQPVALFNRTVDDRLILGLLGFVTILFLVLTGVWLNVLVSISVGALIVWLHAALRITQDLYLDEPDMVDGGLHSVVDSTPRFGYVRV